MVDMAVVAGKTTQLRPISSTYANSMIFYD